MEAVIRGEKIVVPINPRSEFNMTNMTAFDFPRKVRKPHSIDEKPRAICLQAPSPRCVSFLMLVGVYIWDCNSSELHELHEL